MTDGLRGLYLIGNKPEKKVTAVLVQDLASGGISTLPLEQYVNRGIEPADGTLPWEQDITPKPAAPSARPFQPDPSQWGTSNWDDAAARIATSHSERNAALLDSGGSQVFPQIPPANSAATVDAPADAGAAPHEMKLETGKYDLAGGSVNAVLTAAGSLTVNADVVPSEKTRVIGLAISFRDDLERAEQLARAMAGTLREEICRLKNRGRNEPEWRDQIDFLELAAVTLDQIAAAIAKARRAATPEEREETLKETEGLATSLAKAAKNFAERNYKRVIDYGGYSTMAILGTVLFTNLFGVPADEALAIQMLLLGFSGKQKD